MGGNSKLFAFIFRTIKTSANDPKSKNFLPVLLSGIQSGGAPLLPLKEDNWTIGKLGGSNGLTIANMISDQYYQINGTPAIPYPKDPDPSLDLKDSKGVNKVIINGLENVYITDFTNYNYDAPGAAVTADIKMQFNYWTKNPAGLQPGQKISKLSLSAPFILTQNLCLSQNPDDATCIDPAAPPVQIVGEGTFSADITQLNFTASIKITVAPNRSGLNLAITKLTLVTTGDQAPQFANVDARLSNDSIFRDIISTLITNFMSAPDASEAVFGQMQDSLNGPDNINALTNTLNAQVGTFLDARLGAVTGPLPGDAGQQATNKVDLYLFDRIRYSLNNPASNWYVKTLLENYKNPSLNPFRPQNLTIGSFPLMAGINLSNVTLSNIVITGFPNAKVPAERMLLTPPTLQMTLVLGALNTTTATADFYASYPGGELRFGITVAINSVSLSSVITPGGDDAGTLVVTFNSIDFQVPAVDNMKITLSDQSDLGPVVQRVLNTSAVQQKIVAAIKSQFNNHLTDISNEVTRLTRAMLTQQLGGN
ncbi:hypothetical protein FAM09_16780 [Niastella caeni]|uniref:Uncharacterized protein n=1 Tax=Niastella caeni TaxID=2569763 RepID=A0A4S8HS96_9BACT|nr:hypothetical protein [Niastella caeni]THU38330.1 hypothetical protein FAM09_16780 [Niastella caeni]